MVAVDADSSHQHSWRSHKNNSPTQLDLELLHIQHFAQTADASGEISSAKALGRLRRDVANAVFLVNFAEWVHEAGARVVRIRIGPASENSL